jgi:hypothetical protein
VAIGNAVADTSLLDECLLHALLHANMHALGRHPVLHRFFFGLSPAPSPSLYFSPRCSSIVWHTFLKLSFLQPVSLFQYISKTFAHCPLKM